MVISRHMVITERATFLAEGDLKKTSIIKDVHNISIHTFLTEGDRIFLRPKKTQ